MSKIDKATFAQTTRFTVELLKRGDTTGFVGVAILMAVSALMEIALLIFIVGYVGLLSSQSSVESPVIEKIRDFFPTTNDFSVHLYVGIILIGLFVLSSMFRTVTLYLQSDLVQRQRHSLSSKLLSQIIYEDYEESIKRHSGATTAKIIGEIDEFLRVCVTPLLNLISSLLIILCVLSYLLTTQFKVTVVIILSLLFLYVAIYRLLKKMIIKTGNVRHTENMKRFQIASELIGGSKAIKINGGGKIYLNRFINSSLLMSQALTVGTVLGNAPRYWLEAFGFITVLTIVMIIYWYSGHAGLLEYSSVITAFLFAAYRLLPSFQTCFLCASSITFAAPAIKTLLQEFVSFEATVFSIENDEQIKKFDQIEKRIGGWSEIRFENVSYIYPRTSKFILRNINFSIEKGDKILLSGPSGSGKSTLLDVFLMLLSPTSGNITLDGEKSLSPSDWHKEISYVPQNIFILDDSLEANIAFGEEEEYYDLEKIKKCINICQLSDFHEEFLLNSDANLGENGMLLSGGQRQRVGIARALYRQTSILVLDEATSGIDLETENKLFEAIFESFPSLTVINVSHRENNSLFFNRFLSLNEGVFKYEQ